MRVKNSWFILLLWIFIFVITAVLLSNLHSRIYREAIKVPLDNTKPIIAFTFDDGPNELYTHQVLDILYEKKVPATFFVLGKNIEGNECILKEIVQSGHELGNHTYSHADLTTLDQEEIISEIGQTQELVEKVIPGYALKYVRPPYGRCNQAVEEAINGLVVLWEVDSGDWEKVEAQIIYNTVVDNVRDGDIIVFHDGNSSTVVVLKEIISELQARGYQFGTLSQLYNQRRKEINWSLPFDAVKPVDAI